MSRRDPFGKWAVVGQALSDWSKTARLVVLLVVMATCAGGPAALVVWLLLQHGASPTEVVRVVGGWFSR